MTLHAAPLWARELPVSSTIVRHLSVRGIMETAVGHQYTADELSDWDEIMAEDFAAIGRVRAFAVPSLCGQEITIANDLQLSTAIGQLLEDILPPFTWDLADISLAPLHKYLIFHTSLPAPTDLATNQPMALELYGSVIRVNDMPIASAEGRTWLHEWQKYYRKMIKTDRGQIALTEHLTLEMQTATYANIHYPKINVPFYL